MAEAEQNGKSPAQPKPLPRGPQHAQTLLVDFQLAWKAGRQPRLEDFLRPLPLTLQSRWLYKFLQIDVVYRKQQGNPPSLEEYLVRLPALKGQIRECLPEIFASVGLYQEQPSMILAAVRPLVDKLAPQQRSVGSSILVRPKPESPNQKMTLPPLAPPADAQNHTAVGKKKNLRTLADWVREGPPSTTSMNRAPVSGLDIGCRLGQYRLEERIGQGSMSEVFRARNVFRQELVAVKVLNALDHKTRHALNRFRREIRALTSLDHPNLLEARNAGEQDGILYLVTKWVDGIDLHRLIRRYGPMPIPEACEVIRQTALGLDYAHQLGLVHRDIKPSNLMLTEDGLVKVLDMGLVRIVSASPGSALTSPGQLMGTIDFMAPEQAINASQVDYRADLYSLGCTFYFLLTGKPPFGDQQTVARKLLWHQTEDPVPIERLVPETPFAIGEVIRCLMRKQPHERYKNALDVVYALRPFAVASLDGRLAAWRGKPEVPVTPSNQSGKFATPADVGSDAGTADIAEPDVLRTIAGKTSQDQQTAQKVSQLIQQQRQVVPTEPVVSQPPQTTGPSARRQLPTESLAKAETAPHPIRPQPKQEQLPKPKSKRQLKAKRKTPAATPRDWWPLVAVITFILGVLFSWLFAKILPELLR